MRVIGCGAAKYTDSSGVGPMYSPLPAKSALAPTFASTVASKSEAVGFRASSVGKAGRRRIGVYALKTSRGEAVRRNIRPFGMPTK